MRTIYCHLYKLTLTSILLLSSLITLGQEIDSLKYPFKKESGGVYLESPMGYYSQYDPKTGNYILRQKIGNLVYGSPIILTQEEYMNYLLSNSMGEYYLQKSKAVDDQYRTIRYKKGETEDSKSKGLVLPSLTVKNKIFQTIFGGDKIELIPKGYASLDLGVFMQKLDNPQILPQNRSSFAIDLQQRIQLSVLGKVGKNLQLEANYDTQAGFGFENRMNLGWRPDAKGGEDNIIQNIEVGNVNMKLNTSLITGAQSLFGAKTELKFGNTYITTLFSQQESETKTVVAKDGGTVNTFKIYANEYEANQHYFLSQYFRETYDNALANYPFISSEISITRLEVWVIDKGNANQDTRRTTVALRDLGNNNSYPDNGNLYNKISSLNGIRRTNTAEDAITKANLVDAKGQTYTAGEQFLVHENVRLLNTSEYQFYSNLGYISLNQPLNDNELLAVSFQYTLTSQPGKSFNVGEFSDQQKDVLITKLIKSNTVVNTKSPMWNLMMKNIYSLDAYQLSQEDFRLNIFYLDTKIGTAGLNYLQGTPVENKSLIQVLNLDRLNTNGEVQPNGDGLFDFVNGITVDTNHARIIFTTVEPFSKTIEKAIGSDDSQYVLKGLYNELPITFEQDPTARRYYMEGQYKSSGGGGISLGAFNVPQGSVKVTANGQELIEGVDYTVDYMLGQVTIINDIVKNSGAPINISLENQSVFNTQTKRLMGINVEHKFSDNLLVGATYMNYKENMPGTTQKAQYNVEPVSNSIIGGNILYDGKSEWLTRMTDKIPLVDTDVESKINFTAEGAYLMPGTNNATNNQSYVDDFEDAQYSISLTDVNSWRMASTPISSASVPNPDFPSSIFNPDDLSLNYNRRMISWYNIDPRFYNSSGKGAISNTDLSNNASRRVLYREIFSGRDFTAGAASYLNTFDITYFPEERGAYNLNPNWENETLQNLWGGLVRPLNVTNLKQANVEYIEFWMMDPYLDGMNDAPDGKILLQLGSVSEDLLRDGNLLYENGINRQGDAPEQTQWGKQPSDNPIMYAFSNNDDRINQDVGYNGLTNEEETITPGYSDFSTWTNPVTQTIDPAGDDFVYYLNNNWSNTPKGNYLPERYKYFRNPQNNSPNNSEDASTTIPDAEDVNMDYNLDRIENYNQYTIQLGKNNLNLNNRFIVDVKETQGQFENGQPAPSKWYLFRIPISEYDKNAGASSDNVLTAARYMRLIVKGFKETTTLRFGTMDMVRSNWIKYQNNLYPNISIPEGQQKENTGNLTVGMINIEENGTGTPPYVVPPGIRREQLQTSSGLQSQNEASMVLQLSRLEGADARGVMKNTSLDLRRYKHLKMFTHVHAGNQGQPSNQLKFFIRLGSDAVDNYYEYEIPLEYTKTGAISPTEIWPQANIIDLNMQLLIDVKKEAYKVNATGRFGIPIEGEPGKFIYVKGKPSLGSISTVMLGVRNSGQTPIDDAIVWVNELRLAEISNEGGYAAMANLNMNLGDLAQINASGHISSVGFGAIDQGPVNRQQEEIKSYSINTSINIDKFLPKKWGVKIPFNYSIQEEFIDPKYNPLDNDIIFKDDPRNEELQKIVRSYSKNVTYSFNNIRKERTNRKKKPKFYDIENLSFSALYNSNYFRNIYTRYNVSQNLRASLNYNHTFKPKYYQPFKDWHMVHDTAQSAEYLQWVKEFNVNYTPSRISFRTDIIRTYTEQQYRDISSYITTGVAPVSFRPTYSNNFLFNWQYNIGFDITRSLRVDFSSSTRTISDIVQQQPDQQFIFKNLLTIGRPINYNQQLKVNWKTPIRLMPYLEWLDVEVGYNANYDWQAILANFSTINNQNQNLGNLSQNAQTINTIGKVDFTKLYGKFDIFEKANAKRDIRQRELDSINKSFDELAKKKNGLKRIRKKKIKLKNKLNITDHLLLAIQSIKRGQFNYTKTSGIILPGMLAEPNFIGQGANGPGPNTSFMFGSQADFRRIAVENGWVTNSTYLTQPYTSNQTHTFTANLQIEPTPSLIIDLNARRNYNRNFFQSGFNTILSNGKYGYNEAFENIQENLTVSTIGLGATFMNKDDLYNNLKTFAQQISIRKGAIEGLSDSDGNGYAQGYGLANADILVPAFIKAYQGKGLPKNNFSFKDEIPLPNWNITYTGLNNNTFVSKFFQKLNISHNYISTTTVSGVQSNLSQYANQVKKDSNGNIITDSNGNPTSGIDGNNNIYSTQTYGAVTLMESFSPLIGVDATLRNNIQIRAQYNRDRLSSLSLSNYTVTEDYGTEYVIGFGYIIKDVKLKMRYMGKRKIIKGDLNIRADLSMRDNEISIRRILDDDLQISGGQKLFSLKFNAQYTLSKNFNVSLFYDQMITKYKISSAFPLSTLRAGLSATFTFGN